MNCDQCGTRTGETDRFCPGCGTPLRPGGGSREARKSVSILFMDMVGSTALAERLDPEPLRQIMDRYFAVCAASIAEHGGVVEKFIGDAVLAVFGAMVAREDDALRAVRAASGALAALRELSADLTASHQVILDARCGICSGDVMVITAPGAGFRVVGDAVNTASRLQNAAEPGQILIGADTAAMVRGQAGIEPVPPLRLKGKARAVPAWQVTSLVPAPDGSPVAQAAPLIGRNDELAELADSFRRVARRRQVCLVTVLGAPGIGKSRLVQEFLASLTSDQATVLAGRCSAYGKGVTYKPLADILESGPGGWPALAAALSEDPELGSRAARSLETIRRASPGTAAPPAAAAGIEEISWAVRHLLERISSTRPTVVVWEDLHWAEGTLLGLIDDVASWLSDAAVLLLCVARSELLDKRPSWGGGKPRALTLELGPLTFEQSMALVGELASHGDVHPHGLQDDPAGIAARCDGNPLFAELMLDVAADVVPDSRIPPTINALLGARLDQLPDAERQAVEMAAVIGREFTRDALRAITGESGIGPAAADELLIRLARRRIIQRAGPGGFRFTQSLLRDTAYACTPKARRERWHLFLAGWLDGQRTQPAPGTGADDPLIMACHVEAACLLRRKLRPGDPGLPGLAGPAAAALIAEGMRALNRKDLPAAAGLLERGRDLLPAGDSRHTALALHICDSALGLWDEDRSLGALAAAEAALPGDRRNAVTCAIQRGIVSLRLGRAAPGQVAAGARALAADLDADPGNDLGWCRLHQLEAYLHLAAERAAAADAAFRLAMARAQATADSYEADRLLCALCELAQWTPEHLSAGLDMCATLSRRFAANRALLVPVLVTRAYLVALAGQLASAREALATALSYAGDLHLDRGSAAVLEMSGFVESLAGAHGTAETHYREARSVLRVASHSPEAAALEADIARELFEQGHCDAAAAALDRLAAGERLGVRPRIGASLLRGRIASARGQHERAVASVTTAAELASQADDPCLAGQALFGKAIVLRAAGLDVQAISAGREAASRYAAKGASLLAARVWAWLPAGTAAPGGGDPVG